MLTFNLSLGVTVRGPNADPGGADGLVFDRVSCSYFDPSWSAWRQTGAPFGSAQTDFFADGSKQTSAPGVRIKQAPPGAAAGGGCAFTVNQFGLEGVPTELGTFTGNFDASGAFAGDAYTINVSLLGGCPLIDIAPPPEIDESSEHLLTGGTYTNLEFTASNGVAPYTWDLVDGDLPDGMTFDSAGVLAGTPAAAGDYPITVRATDDNGCPGILEFTIEVVDPDPIVVHPDDPILPAGKRGWLYVQIFTAEGGAGEPYTFTIPDSEGELPDGLILSPSGVLSGLPTVAGTFVFTVRATDDLELFGEREYTLIISGLRIEIGGDDATPEIAAAEIELGLNRQATARLEIGDGYVPARGSEILIYARDGVTPIFGGVVLVRRLQGMTASNPANRANVDCVGFEIYIDDADPVTLNYAAPVELEDLIDDIVTASLAVYGITYAADYLGITIPPFTWGTIEVADAFKRITDSTGLAFRVLPLKELDVFAPAADPAPVSITDANINAFDLEWQDPPNLPRNTVDLLCGPTGNAIATQEWEVDSGEISWEVDIQAVIGDASPARRANAYLSPVDATNFSDGDTIGAGSSTYTFRTALVGDVAGEVLIGGTVNESLENLNAAINLAGGGVYAPSTAANADVSSYIRNPGQLEVDALTAGAAGNAITVTSSHEAVAFWYGEGGIPRGTLQLGADATGAAGWTQGYVLEDGAVARPLGAVGSGAFYEWDVTAGKGTVTIGSGTAPPEGTILELKYLAVFPFHARYSTGTPPITFRENHPEIASYADGIALAIKILARESASFREVEVFTDVDGFLPGQGLEIDTTYRNGLVGTFLVGTVRIKLVNAELWEYLVAVQESAEYLGSYVEEWKSLTSGGGGGSTTTPATITDGGVSAAGDVYTDGRNAFRADQSMGGHKLRSVDDPAVDPDAANKGYVDGGDAATLYDANAYTDAAVAGAVGTFVQEVYSQTSAVATGTTQIPFDDTIPQNSEGDEYLTVTITPQDAGHKLRIAVNVFVTVTTTPWVTAALFRDSGNDAIGVASFFPNLSTAGGMIAFQWTVDAGSTSATTFKLRIGPSNAATVTLNGQSGGRKFGGVAASRMAVTEYIP